MKLTSSFSSLPACSFSPYTLCTIFNLMRALFVLAFQKSITCFENSVDSRSVGFIRSQLIRIHTVFRLLSESILTVPLLAVTFVVCKQLGSRSGPAFSWSSSGSKLLDNLCSLRILNKLIRSPDKGAYLKIIFHISQPKHMLWRLKRTVSVRLFF